MLDPAELDFPFRRITRFRDLETGAEVRTFAPRVRAPYREAMGELVAAYERNLRLADVVDYHRLDTGAASRRRPSGRISRRGARRP